MPTLSLEQRAAPRRRMSPEMFRLVQRLRAESRKPHATAGGQVWCTVTRVDLLEAIAALASAYREEGNADDV